MIGIITVNWNGYEMSLNFTRQVLRSTCQDFRLVIVNNSPDENQKFDGNNVFSDCRIEIIHTHQNIGYAGGLNVGIRTMLPFPNINYFLLINNDVEFDEEFLSQILVEAKEKDKIYAPVILHQGTEIVQNTGGAVYIWLGGAININQNKHISKIRKKKPDFISGCIMFMHREIIENVGLFDETFGSYCEDLDYCYRTQKQGFDFEILWNVKARHYHSYSTQSVKGYKIYLINRNEIIFAKKHLPPVKKEIFIFAAILRGAVQGILANQFPAFYQGVKEGLLL